MLTTLALMLPLACPQDPAKAQAAIRLDGVPARFVLPVPPGTNILLRASVDHATPTEVWLATSRGATKKLALSGSGKEWQINLADPRVHALAADAPERSFRVFARISKTRIIASTSISFLLTEGLKRAAVYVEVDGVRRRVGTIGRPWQRPASIARLVVTDPTASVARDFDTTQLAATLKIGAKSISFVASDKERVLVLPLTADIRRAWETAGVARVEHSRHGKLTGHVAIRAIPERLVAPEASIRVRVMQREEASLPHTNDWLFVRCGDVTGGQVAVTVRQADGLTLFTRRSMKQGDEIAFEQHGRRYTLVLDKLVNVLIGSDDFAEFTLQEFSEQASVQREEQRLIRDLIAQLFAEPGLRYVREGVEYTPRQAKKHLEAKATARGVKSAEAFIRDVASRSSTTGRPYRVLLPSGKGVDAEKWLRARLAELRESRRRPAK